MEEKKEEKVETTKKSSKKEIENLKELLLKAEESANDYKDKWMRNVAEFDNYKKRNAKIWQDAFNEGVVNTINKILPIGDNLDWAINMDLDEKTKEGLINLRRKYLETLVDMGIEEIDPTGKPFDPNEAEAVMQVEGVDGEEPDTVKQVFQKGYRIKEKVIRYAKVSVVK